MAILLLAVLGLQALNIFGEVQNIVLDKLFVDRESGGKVVILGIDDASLSEIGAWPWNREVFADVINRLNDAGASVISFDIIFAEERDGDDIFVEAIENSRADVILAGKLIEGGVYIDPHDKFVELDSFQTGFVNFESDFDGKTRNTLLINENNDGECRLSLAYMSVKAQLEASPSVECSLEKQTVGFSEFNLARGGIRINYIGSAGSFPTVTVSELLNGETPKGAFRDKIVIIGSVIQDLKSDLQDNLLNPFDGQAVPGVEVHANVMNTILEKEFIYTVPGSAQLILIIIAAAGAYFLNMKFVGLRSFVATMALVLLFIFAVAFAFGLGWIINIISIPLILFSYWIISNFWLYYLKRKENREIKKAFGQYVNEHILSEIIKDPEKLKLGGQQKNLTILFSDIRSFTSISEEIGVKKLVKLLNGYLTGVTAVILEQDGVVDKFIGDAVMALWGAPVDNELHSYSSCVAALGMLEKLRQFNIDHKGEFPEIKVGVGINSGDVIVGNMGSEQRFDYSVLGDNVNLASRLEGLTKQYGVDILLGENTFEHLKEINKLDAFTVRLLDIVTVKGKQSHVKIYELLPQGSKNEKLKAAYEQAFKSYESGNFKKAQRAFDAVHKKYNDSVAQMMTMRSQSLLDSKPKRWKGVWNWKTK
ncbi:MAG: CHASE2 domain-containing protein [Candidatus Dojkabacteria bacterium]